MARDNLMYDPRRPRHQATGKGGIRVQVERSSAAAPGTVEAELVDFSRDGFRLLTAVPLAPRESITVRLEDSKSGFRLALPGTVRWRRAENDQSWAQGCMFARSVDWETLGELFLNEILDMDGPAS